MLGKGILLSCLLLICLNLTAKEIHHLSDALHEIQPDTLVVLDLDQTLITPVQMLAHSEWGHHQTQVLLDSGLDYEQAQTEATHRLMAANQATKVTPVETNTLELVTGLQERGIMVICLTARPGEFRAIAHRQLASVGFDLQATAPPLPEFCLQLGNPSPIYSKGVLFSWRVSKGETLVEFLRATGLHPKHIVYVDDSPRHIQRVAESVKELQISCDLYRYGALDQKRAQFDPMIADFQWEMLHKILSDDQARHLMKQL